LVKFGVQRLETLKEFELLPEFELAPYLPSLGAVISDRRTKG
jgi:hypothetical protein